MSEIKLYFPGIGGNRYEVSMDELKDLAYKGKIKREDKLIVRETKDGNTTEVETVCCKIKGVDERFTSGERDRQAAIERKAAERVAAKEARRKESEAEYAHKLATLEALRKQREAQEKATEKWEVQYALRRSKRFVRLCVLFTIVLAFVNMAWNTFNYVRLENPFVGNKGFISYLEKELPKTQNSPSTVAYVINRLDDDSTLEWLHRIDILTYDWDIEIEHYLFKHKAHKEAMSQSVEVFWATLVVSYAFYCLLMLGISLTQYHAEIVRKAIMEAGAARENDM